MFVAQTEITPLAKSSSPRLLILDRDQVLVDLLIRSLGCSFEIRTAALPDEALELAESFEPDGLLINLDSFIELSTDAFLLRVRERYPLVAVISHSLQAEPAGAYGIEDSGTTIHISRQTSFNDFTARLQQATRRSNYLSTVEPLHADRLLTNRQVEVLKLITWGCSAKEIANHLQISVRTAEFHRAAIMERTGLHSTAQMTRYAVARGIS